LLLDGAEPRRLEAGDVVLLPHGHAHALADDPGTRAEPLLELIARHTTGPGHCPLTFGGDGERVTLICGYFTFSSSDVHPLLSVLPPLIIVHGEGGRARSWLESTLDLIADESVHDRPGGETLINRLTEALFIQVLRSHLAEDHDGSSSWLAGLRDPQIARALGLIHREPQRRWTIDDLAAAVAMSRSGFAARFRDLVGEPPLTYLTRWRMLVAATHLRDAGLTLPEIADRVGYQAEASFSKVFKRLWGVAPAAYRRQITAQP
jgi:AraC-like DNA-binding protein